MRYIFTFLLLSLLTPRLVLSQTSLLEDKSGETSILLNDKKSIFVNVGDGSVTGNVSFSTPERFIGFNIKLKSTQGVSSILEGYEFKPEINLGLFNGNTIKSRKESVIQYIYYGISGNTTNFNLLNKDSSNTFQNKNIFGGSVYFGYNKIGAVKILMKNHLASSYLFGISAEYGLINNLLDLKTVETYTSFSKDTGATKSVLLSDKKSGFSGDYMTFGAFHVNVDAYIYPQILSGQIGVGVYARSQLSGINPRTNIGIGIILGQEGAPTNVIVGLFYQFNDLFNQLNKENDFLKRGGINLVAGYGF